MYSQRGFKLIPINKRLLKKTKKLLEKSLSNIRFRLGFEQFKNIRDTIDIIQDALGEE